MRAGINPPISILSRNSTMNESLNRRDFVKLASLGAATASVLTATKARAGVGANDRLVVALIGCGGRGTSVAGRFRDLPNVEVAWVCDVDQARLATAADHFGVS